LARLGRHPATWARQRWEIQEIWQERSGKPPK
jgi:hypothetical protein